MDFRKKEIKVQHTLLYQKLEGDKQKTFHLDPPKTEKSNRVVPMNNDCEKYLKKQIIQKHVISQRYPNYSEFGDRLFVTSKNTPLNSSLYSSAIHSIVFEINAMRDVFEQIELFSGHSFRHTFATRCYEAGVPIKTLQNLLGHATIQMTMDLYVHDTDERKHEAIAMLPKADVRDELVEERYENLSQKIVLFSA